jgi:hypothetical protein
MGLARITGHGNDRPASFWSPAKRNPPLSIPDAASNQLLQHMRIQLKARRKAFGSLPPAYRMKLVVPS